MAARSIDPFLVQFYDGLDSPVEFEKVYAVTAAMQDWDDAKTLKNLPFFLRGKAKRVYDDLTVKDAIFILYYHIIISMKIGHVRTLGYGMIPNPKN